MSFGQYFSNIYRVGRSIWIGMAITIRYFINHKKTVCTVQYPREHDDIPPRHRGIHYLETEKCVMCWKCADICPVDCIHIEGVRGNDGVLKGGHRGQKATLSKFTIDYTVCIFCGLCEEPCPPKCIFLGPEFDYHSTDRVLMEKNLLTDEIQSEEDEKFAAWAREENERLKAEKKRRTEEEKARKAAEKAKAAAEKAAAEKAAAEKAAAEKAAAEKAAAEKAERIAQDPPEEDAPSAGGPPGDGADGEEKAR